MNAPIQNQTFRFPLILIGLLLFGVVFFGTGAITCAIDWAFPNVTPKWFPKWDENGNPPPPSAILLLLGFTLGTLAAAWVSLTCVQIDSAGITMKRPGLADRHLLWTEISRWRDRPIWQDLQLEGDSGQPVIKIPCPVMNFTGLREIILANAPGLKASAADACKTSLPMTFPASIMIFFALAIFGAILLLWSVVWWNNDSTWLAALPFAGALLVFVRIGWIHYSLTVAHDRIILHRLFGPHEIPLVELTAATIKTTENQKFGVTTEVFTALVLQQKNGKSLFLGSFNDQTLFARDLIEMAIKSQAS